MHEKDSSSGFIRKIMKNFVWLLLQLGITRLFGFFFALILARDLRQNDFGIYTYAISLTGIILVIADLGLSSLVFREISRQREKAAEIFSRAFAAKLPLTLGVLILFSIVFLCTHAPGGRLAVLAIAAAFFAQNLAGFFSMPFKATEQMQFLAIGDFVFKLLLISGVWIILRFTSDLLPVGIAYAACGFIYALFYVVLYVRYFSFARISKGLSGFLANSAFQIRNSAPMALAGLIMVVYINADILMIKWFKGEVVTGLYGVSYNFYLGLALAASILVQSMLPRLSYSIENRQLDVSASLLRGAVKLLFIFSVPLALGSFLLSDQLVPFFYGARYMGSVSAFRIFMVAIVFTYFNLLLGNVLFAERKQNEINVIYFITIVINVLFNLILIPRFSLNGAAFATLVAEISFTGIVLFRYPAFLRHFRFDWIWRIACASVAMGLAIVAIRHSIAFPLTVVCGMSVCAGMLAILGTFRSEKELLLGLLRGIRI